MEAEPGRGGDGRGVSPAIDSTGVDMGDQLATKDSVDLDSRIDYGVSKCIVRKRTGKCRSRVVGPAGKEYKETRHPGAARAATTYAFGISSSHYTSSSPPGHPYPHKHATLYPVGTVYTPQHGASPSASHHDTPSPPVHVLPAQHGTIPSSSHHSTPSPPGYVYPHEHGIRPSSSHHATPSPSAHPAHSP
ncbi:hypothetical protein Scep_030217 [Stephania cephalantha]|uniref:Uncharacterized protein n=1 Tax=Stephania cephalantha TaxID=152367 RepID=A0AAP0HGN7_9MAGN